MIIHLPKKKTLRLKVLVGLLLLLGGTIYGGATIYEQKEVLPSASLNQDYVEVQQLAAAPDFFVEYRLEREKVRSEKSDVLREIIKNSQNEDARTKAQETVLKLVQDKQKELEIENLIKARGFNDALVFIREGSVSAVVKAPVLTRQEVTQIADIIHRSAGVNNEEIQISAKP